MKLSDEQKKSLNESLKTLKEMFKHSLENFPRRESVEMDNEFVQMVVQKYLTGSGLIDLLEDFDLLSKPKACPCAAPCTVSCVSCCASVCYYSTKADHYYL
jgi:hypothetical protein